MSRRMMTSYGGGRGASAVSPNQHDEPTGQRARDGPLRDVEYLLTEGGANVLRSGKLEYYSVGVAEKRTFWQRRTVTGTPSHGSRPTKANPVPRLVAALSQRHSRNKHNQPSADLDG